MPKPKGNETVATNRRALYRFEILETYEAGLSLMGPEVKSLRNKKASMEGSFARLERDEVFLYNLHIDPYIYNTLEPLEPRRTRKLLLHRKEIKRLLGRMTGKRLTLVPLELYFKRGWAKVRLALARGKLGKDRREDIRKRDTEREISRALRSRQKRG